MDGDDLMLFIKNNMPQMEKIQRLNFTSGFASGPNIELRWRDNTFIIFINSEGKISVLEFVGYTLETPISTILEAFFQFAFEKYQQ